MITAMSYHEARTGVVHHPAGASGYLLVLLHQALLVRVRGVEQECPAGSVMLWAPGEPRYFGRPRATWEYTGIEFDGEEVHAQLAALGIPCHRLLLCAEPATLDELLKWLNRERRRPQVDDVLVHHLFQAGLRLLSRLILHHGEAPADFTALQEIKAYLDAHYAAPVQLAELAARFQLSRSYFSQLFKREFGLPAIKYITRLRLEAGRRLLEDPALTIAEIAHQVGYANEFYFTNLFRRNFRETPSSFRRRFDRGRERVAQADPPTPNRWEGWRTIVDHSFLAGADLDPHWRAYSFSTDLQHPQLLTAPQSLRLQGDRLCLLPSCYWTNLRWEEEITEECLVELSLVNPRQQTGVNLAIALSGDLCDGYRLRLYEDTIILETIAHGHWQVLVDCPQRLDPQASTYHIVFWRVRDEFFAEINGERVLAYYDPFAPNGPGHRTIAIGRFGLAGNAQVTALRVRARPHTLPQDALEPGHVLFRKGYFAEARQWYLDAACEQADPRLQQEADYYAVLSLPDHAPEREAGLRRISENDGHAFRSRALHVLALQYAAQRQFSAAVETAVCLATLTPTEDISQEVASKLVEELHRCPAGEHQVLLMLLARLPITQLYLRGIIFASIAPLSGMSLNKLRLDDSGVTDLTPLRRIPLKALTCIGNELTDLTPLTGMSLETLNCSYNRLTELAPLRGMPLRELNCQNNRITTLSPITGMPLTRLLCGINAITDLSPVQGIALEVLHCAGNRLTDLSPLRGMPLRELDCSSNLITDLSPLDGMPLTRLSLSGNQVHDLSPLREMRLEDVQCDGNPITTLRPLMGMPLSALHIQGIQLEDEHCAVIASLPLRHLWCDFTPEAFTASQEIETLQSFNGFHLEHITAIGAALARLLTSFHRHETMDQDCRDLLRSFAVPCGNSAYLGLPCRLRYHTAADFADWLGGGLPCPATLEQFSLLQQYTASITLHFEYIYFYCGLRIQPDGQYQWSNDTPYTWPIPPRQLSPGFTETSHAVFLAVESKDTPLSIEHAEGWDFVVIEWPSTGEATI